MAHTEHARALIGGRDPDGFRQVRLETPRGTVELRWYDAAGATAAVAMVGGVGGGFDSPARGLYPRLSEDLRRRGVGALRVRFRNPVNLDEARFDLRAGIAFIEQHGVERLGLVGHSFGGAVALQAAVVEPAAKTVVTISTQGYGADAAAHLAADCSLLAIHGEADDVLDSALSEWVHSIAHEPKRLFLIPGGSHVLDESAERVYHEVSKWLFAEFGDR